MAVTEGGDVRFLPTEPRTDFKEQIAAGNAGVPANRPTLIPTAPRPTVSSTPSGFVVGQQSTTTTQPTTVKIASDPSYSSQMRDQWRQVRVLAKDAYDFSSVADLDSRTEWAAQKYKDQYGVWPSANQLMAYGPYMDSLMLLKSGGAYFDPVFGFYDENGQQRFIVNNGLEWRESNPSIGSLLAGTGEVGSQLQNITVYPDIETVWEIIGSFQPATTRGGGGGGGGGVGRQAMVFDRKQLSEEVTNRWRGMLLEEPDQATLDKVVNGYINDANAFWMNEAGQLDFDTYVVDRIRQQDRYRYLYQKKPEFQSEAEYMTQFRQAAGQFGMNDRATLREVEAGASSGTGIAGFTERVGRTAEVRAANAGTYSQRFAQSMASSGLGGT